MILDEVARSVLWRWRLSHEYSVSGLVDTMSRPGCWRPVVVPQPARLEFCEELARLVLLGRKSCATRHRPHGGRGDVFTVSSSGQSKNYLLVGVQPMLLGLVVEYLFYPAGFASPGELSRAWQACYPGEDPSLPGPLRDMLVFVHWWRPYRGMML